MRELCRAVGRTASIPAQEGGVLRLEDLKVPASNQAKGIDAVAFRKGDGLVFPSEENPALWHQRPAGSALKKKPKGLNLVLQRGQRIAGSTGGTKTEQIKL